MRWLKMLLAAISAIIAVALGVFAIAFLIIALAGYLVVKLLLRRASARRLAHQTPLPPRSRVRAHGDVIDVTATEVGERLTK